MTSTLTTPVLDTPATATRAKGTAEAEAYFTAERMLKEWKKSAEGKRIANLEADKKNALDTLKGMFKPARGEAAKRRFSIFNNATVQFSHVASDTVSWKSVAEGLLPYLTAEQVATYNRLKSHHTSESSRATIAKV